MATPRGRLSDAEDRRARDETPAERLDRNGNELLQELRVAQTGAQILAAFRRGRKRPLVGFADAAARAGLACLSVVVALTVALAFWLALGGGWAVAAGAVALVVIAGGWFAVPPLGLRRPDGAGAASG